MMRARRGVREQPGVVASALARRGSFCWARTVGGSQRKTGGQQERRWPRARVVKGVWGPRAPGPVKARSRPSQGRAARPLHPCAPFVDAQDALREHSLASPLTLQRGFGSPPRSPRACKSTTCAERPSQVSLHACIPASDARRTAKPETAHAHAQDCKWHKPSDACSRRYQQITTDGWFPEFPLRSSPLFLLVYAREAAHARNFYRPVYLRSKYRATG